MMKRKTYNPQPPKGRGRPSSTTEKDMVTNALSNTETVSEPPTLNRHLILSQQGCNLLKFLNEDRFHQKFCDVVVSVGEKRYRAHKVVLAQGSSYFHAELSKNPATENLTLDHVEESVFRHLLDFLYTSECIVSDTEFLVLVTAARLLDMRGVVKLLDGCAYTPATPTKDDVQVEGQAGAEAPPLETTEHAEARSLAGVKCLLCSRRFCYPKSLVNHLAKSHGSTLTDSVEREKSTGQDAATTRRSARRRRAPAKFKRHSDESSSNTEDKTAQDPTSEPRTPSPIEEEEEEQVVVKKRQQKHKSDSGKMPTASTDQEEDEAEEGAIVVCAVEENGGRSYLGTAEDQAVNELEVSSQTPVGCSSSPVYPAGLAPLVINSDTTKTLQCPKCDKTFDRTGKYESHTRVHTGEKPFQCDICLQRYSTKSNLTVHKKKHAGDTPLEKKEHHCPFCNKLHASRKTLGKHVQR